jgi:hypothetical protein
MSVAGIAGSLLSILSGSQSNQNSPFQQIQSEFQQLGQDLQTGNLSQAQQVFSTLSQTLTGGSQATAASSNSPLAQTFNQLGQDLQAGNLQAAQQDFTTLTQDAQQTVQQVGGHHHHFHPPSQQSSSTSQLSSSIAQEFSQLAQTLTGGNLQGAQQAFSTLPSDLQQLGGFGSDGSSSSVSGAAAGGLNVTA